MNIPVSKEALYRVFGPDAFSFALFYANAPALRFELARGDSPVERFATAFDRAREIAGAALRDAPTLVLVLSYFGSGPPVQHLAVFRSVRACGIRLGRPRSCWTEPSGDEDLHRTFVAVTVERSALPNILWGALAAELGIFPRLLGHAYVADPQNGILVHPYDDRGMDVIAPNRERLAELFARFPEDLLGYDRERMDGFFAPAPV